MLTDPTADIRVRHAVEDHPERLLFASLSGAHLYGFPSQDSDVDIRGAHILAPEAFLRLAEPPGTFEWMDVVEDLELDVVTYDLKKFCQLLLKKNGNVLEQLVSPHVVATSPEHEELRALAARCVTKHHVHHYRGMTKNRLQAFEESRDIKPLLYAIRSALTGIHLLRTGECQPDLTELAEPYGVDGVDDLVEQKRGAEHSEVEREESRHWSSVVTGLLEDLEEAFEASTLPESPSAAAEVDDFLVRVRMQPK